VTPAAQAARSAISPLQQARFSGGGGRGSSSSSRPPSRALRRAENAAQSSGGGLPFEGEVIDNRVGEKRGRDVYNVTVTVERKPETKLELQKRAAETALECFGRDSTQYLEQSTLYYEMILKVRDEAQL